MSDYRPTPAAAGDVSATGDPPPLRAAERRRLVLVGVLVGWVLGVAALSIALLVVYLCLTFSPFGRLAGRALNVAEGRHTIVVDAAFRREFLRLAFGEHGRILRRWSRPLVTVTEQGPRDETDPRLVREALAQIAPLTSGVRFRLVAGPADITIRYVDAAVFSREVDEPDAVGSCRLRVGPLALLHGETLSSATILIDTAPEHRPSRPAILLHELLHAIGFQGHASAADGGTMDALYRSSTTTSLTQRDRQAIRLLYSGRLAAGMTRYQVEDLLTVR